MNRAWQHPVTEPRILSGSPTRDGTSNDRFPVVVSERADGRDQELAPALLALLAHLDAAAGRGRPPPARPPRRRRLRIRAPVRRPQRLRPLRRAPPGTSPSRPPARRRTHPRHRTTGVGRLVGRGPVGLRRRSPTRTWSPRPGGPGRTDRHLLAPSDVGPPAHAGRARRGRTGSRARPPGRRRLSPPAPSPSPASPSPHHLLAPSSTPALARHRHETTERLLAGPPLSRHGHGSGLAPGRCDRAQRPQRRRSAALSVRTAPTRIRSVQTAPEGAARATHFGPAD
jgi:hypothetical protein